jgi:hypothetical protein
VIFPKEKPPEILSRPSVPRITAFSSSEGDVACTSAHYEFGGPGSPPLRVLASYSGRVPAGAGAVHALGNQPVGSPLD